VGQRKQRKGKSKESSRAILNQSTSSATESTNKKKSGKRKQQDSVDRDLFRENSDSEEEQLQLPSG
jgi:hypothetical protein